MGSMWALWPPPWHGRGRSWAQTALLPLFVCVLLVSAVQAACHASPPDGVLASCAAADKRADIPTLSLFHVLRAVLSDATTATVSSTSASSTSASSTSASSTPTSSSTSSANATMTSTKGTTLAASLTPLSLFSTSTRLAPTVSTTTSSPVSDYSDDASQSNSGSVDTLPLAISIGLGASAMMGAFLGICFMRRRGHRCCCYSFAGGGRRGGWGRPWPWSPGAGRGGRPRPGRGRGRGGLARAESPPPRDVPDELGPAAAGTLFRGGSLHSRGEEGGLDGAGGEIVAATTAATTADTADTADTAATAPEVVAAHAVDMPVPAASAVTPIIAPLTYRSNSIRPGSMLRSPRTDNRFTADAVAQHDVPPPAIPPRPPRPPRSPPAREMPYDGRRLPPYYIPAAELAGYSELPG